MADFASAFLARDQSAATDFELRVLVGRLTPCAPHLRRAEDCPPYQIIAAIKARGRSETSAKLDRGASALGI